MVQQQENESATVGFLGILPGISRILRDRPTSGSAGRARGAVGWGPGAGGGGNYKGSTLVYFSS